MQALGCPIQLASAASNALHKDLPDVTLDPFVEDLDQEAAVLRGSNGTLRYEVSLLNV